MKRLLFALMILIPMACFGQGGSNVKIITSLNIANVTGSYSYVKTYLSDVKVVNIQVDWSGLTGTLDGYIKISQRNESTMQWLCVDSTSTTNSFKITLSTATGHHDFLLPYWGGSDFQILFVKNNCTGGYINASCGVRK
jgi:hypothetical protein